MDVGVEAIADDLEIFAMVRRELKTSADLKTLPERIQEERTE